MCDSYMPPPTTARKVFNSSLEKQVRYVPVVVYCQKVYRDMYGERLKDVQTVLSMCVSIAAAEQVRSFNLRRRTLLDTPSGFWKITVACPNWSQITPIITNLS